MREFETMAEAFDYCRKCGHPVHVKVEGIAWKIFPSGRADVMRMPDDEIVVLKTYIKHKYGL